MSEELKPCPFCGGKAEMMGDQYPYVECTGCTVNFSNDHSYEFDHEDAVQKWNTRHSPDTQNDPVEQLAKIRNAIRKYYLALDNRQHGGVAESTAFSEIQEVLGMTWVQGEVKQFLEDHPKMRPFYGQSSAQAQPE